MFLHFTERKLRSVEETGGIDSSDRSVLSFGVFGERLRDEDAGVVDQRVDTSEAGNGFEYCALSGGTLTDIAPDRNDLIIFARLDCTRDGDNSVVAIAICLDQSRTDSLRSSCNHGNLMIPAHGKHPLWLSNQMTWSQT